MSSIVEQLSERWVCKWATVISKTPSISSTYFFFELKRNDWLAFLVPFELTEVVVQLQHEELRIGEIDEFIRSEIDRQLESLGFWEDIADVAFELSSENGLDTYLVLGNW